MKHIYNILHYLKYGRTQSSVFNDLSSKDQVKIIRGAMREAKKIQDEVLRDSPNIETIHSARPASC
jgi:hypothetical protein